MAARNGEVALQLDERESPAAHAVRLASLCTPFQTPTTLAVETGHAIMPTFGESDLGTSEHSSSCWEPSSTGSKHNTLSKSDDRPQRSIGPEALVTDDQFNAAQRRAEMSPVGVDPEAVRADIDRVQRKTLSTNAATEVILRFNFLGGRESKVR